MRFRLNSAVMTVAIGSYRHNYSKDLGVEQNVRLQHLVTTYKTGCGYFGLPAILLELEEW